MIDYRILIKDHNGNSLGELTEFRKLKFGKNLNDYGSCEFEVPVVNSKAGQLIVPRRYKTYIYRREDEEYEGDLVWAGEQASRTGELKSDNNNWLKVTNFTWFEQLYHRYTAAEVRYDEIDAGAIAWDMIDDTQNDSGGYGDIGITEGSIATTMDRDREYYTQNIAEGIINLCNVINGFDFDITDNKVFNVYSVKGIDKSEDVVFIFGHNVREIKIIEDFTNPVNRAIVLGEASDIDELARKDVNNTDFQKTYGLREGRLSEMDITDEDSLTEKGQSMIRKYQLPLLKLEMQIKPGSSPNITDFELGDLITIVVNKGIYNIQKQYRVFGWELEFTENKAEVLKLTLGDFTLYGT